MASPILHPRATDFAPDVYYVFHNAFAPNSSLNAGQGQNTKGAIGMNVAWTFSSSENWQLYFQQGRYFIRNYDYGGQWQLGLTEDSPVVPKLLKRSGGLGQQWTMERQDDGTYKFHNGLLGNTSALALAVRDNAQPGMQSAASGSKWEIIVNLSAKAPKDPTMMQDVTDFEVQTTSSSISSTPSPTSTPISTGTSSTATSTITNNSLASNPSPNSGIDTSPKSSSALAPGAIAGIAVGIVVILAVLGVISYFLWARRKAKEPTLPTAELGGEKMYYAHRQQYPVQLDDAAVRYEMEDAPVESQRSAKTPNVRDQRFA